MKKKYFLLTLMFLITANAFPIEVEIDGLWYDIITKGDIAKVITYKNNIEYSGDIVIPETIKYEGVTYSVTGIENYAFCWCRGLASIIIPNSIKNIGIGAFKGCSSLTSVTIPEAVTTIEEQVFADCNGLTSVIIGNNVKKIEKDAFYNCNGLNAVHISDLESWCKITFSFNWTPSNPLYYAHHLFLNGEEIKDLVIPNSVTEIGEWTFTGCSGLTSIEFGSNVATIGKFAFCFCDGLTSVQIPNSITTIGQEAFNVCEGLASVTIGDGVTSIGERAFAACSSLTSVTIGNNVKNIGFCAFENCSSLTYVRIPNSVTTIEYYAFKGCSGLTSLIIGNSVNTIYSQAFASCKDLTDVYCLAENVPDMLGYNGNCTDAFQDSYIEYATLHVPETSISSYQAIEPWKNFKIIKKIMPEYTLTYIVDGEIYKSYQVEEDAIITPETSPKKEGYTFSGWSEIPETMPAHEVTVTGTFTINKYRLIYTVDGEEHKSYEIEYGASITPEPAPTKEGYSFSGWSEIPETLPDHDVTVTGTFTINKYKLTYTVDGKEYKSYDVEYGATITPEPAPTKVGYIFSGWSDIPETMPAYDVTVIGTFIINKYKLTYTVNGEEYKSYELDYGTSITSEPAPTKEGYTFSGWSEIPETMPAHDVTITGTFTINKYKLAYIVDGAEYKSYELEYGAAITPEPTPEKEGYTFSGWSEIPETMPAYDVTVTGTFIINKYKLTYIVDGQTYKTYDVEFGAAITPEPAPTKEGYTFSGWSEIPEIMPAYDVTVTGTFTKGAYILTYMVDGKVYKTVSCDYGDAITPEPAPTKEGYTFSDWSEIPETMPAHDVTVTGTFFINKYKLNYTVDDEEYKSYEIEYGARITPELVPTKEGYTFSGWSEIPETMPAHDVTVTGSFTINSYKLTYMIDDKVYKETMYEYGATITPEPQPEGDYATFEWIDLPQTMPAHDVVVYASYTSGITDFLMTTQRNIRIYSPNGKKLDKLQKGLNIVVLDDGAVRKVVVK